RSAHRRDGATEHRLGHESGPDADASLAEARPCQRTLSSLTAAQRPGDQSSAFCFPAVLGMDDSTGLFTDARRIRRSTGWSMVINRGALGARMGLCRARCGGTYGRGRDGIETISIETPDCLLHGGPSRILVLIPAYAADSGRRTVGRA